MSLKGQIQDDIKTAMKAGDKDRLKTLRLVSAAIKQVEVDSREELDDAGVTKLLGKMLKQHRDSISQFEKGGRDDLAAIEIAEIAIIQAYLPEALDEAEVDALIQQAIADTGAEGMRDMGKVMGVIKSKAGDRVDMGAVSGKIKAILAQQ